MAKAKLPHFVVGQPGHADKLNAVVDRVNEHEQEIEDLREALAGKADKRNTRASSK
jgi:hypothetical protein